MSEEFSKQDISVQFNAEEDTYVATFDAMEIEPAIAVVKAMASICDAEPTDLKPLQYAVNTTELDSVVHHQISGRPDGDSTVEFTYLGYEVSVKSYGIIEIEPRSDDEADKSGD